jgi:hypothetical protein
MVDFKPLAMKPPKKSLMMLGLGVIIRKERIGLVFWSSEASARLITGNVKSESSNEKLFIN